MANKAKEKSAKQKAAETAYSALEVARAAQEKNNNATTKAAVEKAQHAYDTARNAERRERFVNVAGSRVLIVVAKLGALAKASNKRGYEFSKADVEKMKAELQTELDNTIGTFENALTGKAPTARSKTFSFE